MRSRRKFGLLAVCGLVLGTMAISASAAQAQAGMWMINGSNVGSGVKLVVSFKIELEGGSLTLLSTSGKDTVAITCTTATMAGATVELEVITGTVNFSGCTTKTNGVANAACNPINQPIAASGTIKAVLHESKGYALMEGPAGVISKIKFDEEKCILLPPVISLTGKGWIEDCNNEFSVEKVTHLTQEGAAPAPTLGGGLFFGGNPAEIDGSANITFNDATHTGMKFSGLPE